ESANRGRVITGEERGHRLAAFQNGLRRKVPDVLSFAGIKVVQARRQSNIFHCAPVAFVSSREPRPLTISDQPSIPVSESLQIPRGFDRSFNVVEVERVAMILVPGSNNVIAHYNERDAAVIKQIQEILGVLTREDCGTDWAGTL